MSDPIKMDIYEFFEFIHEPRDYDLFFKLKSYFSAFVNIPKNENIGQIFWATCQKSKSNDLRDIQFRNIRNGILANPLRMQESSDPEDQPFSYSFLFKGSTVFIEWNDGKNSMELELIKIETHGIDARELVSFMKRKNGIKAFGA